MPFRLEIWEKELKEKKLTFFTRDTQEKQKISLSQIKKINQFGKEFDNRLISKADKFLKNKIINCKTKQEIKKVIKNKKIARINFCSIDKPGEKCAEIIEKEINAEVRGTLANKQEKSTGKCTICGKPAKEIVYVAKSY